MIQARVNGARDEPAVIIISCRRTCWTAGLLLIVLVRGVAANASTDGLKRNAADRMGFIVVASAKTTSVRAFDAPRARE